MKVLHKFQIEVYDREQAEELDRLGISNAEEKAEEMIVDLYLDLQDVESFRKTYMLGKKDIECTNIQTKSGETFILLISLNDFLDKYEDYFETIVIK